MEANDSKNQFHSYKILGFGGKKVSTEVLIRLELAQHWANRFKKFIRYGNKTALNRESLKF